MTTPFGFVFGVSINGFVLTGTFLALTLLITVVISLMGGGADGEHSEDFSAFRKAITTEGSGAHWKITTGSIESGPVQWSGTFQRVSPDGTLSIDVPKLPKPVILRFHTTLDAIAVWKSIPADTRVRFQGTLRNAGIVRTYFGQSVLPEGFQVKRNCFNPEVGSFAISGSNKSIMVQGRSGGRPFRSAIPPSRVDVVLYVTEVLPLDVTAPETRKVAAGFLESLTMSGAEIKTDDEGKVVSIQYRDATYLPRGLIKLVQTDYAYVGRLFMQSKNQEQRGAISNESLRLFANYPTLKTLDLYSSNVGDDGVKYLKNCPALEHVGLSVAMTDAGVTHLKQIPRLAILDLLRCDGITDKAVESLQDIKTLRLVILPKSISKEAAGRLHQSNTKCGIFSPNFKDFNTPIDSKKSLGKLKSRVKARKLK